MAALAGHCIWHNLTSSEHQHKIHRDRGGEMVKLHEVKPRECVGRDTLGRYRLQLVAAAYASLKILDGKEIDRVFCDFHDDFVVRYKEDGKHTYHFFQVKTKEKRKLHWSLNQTFGLVKKTYKDPTSEDLKKIRSSYFGKLLEHTLVFGQSCREATLLTNSFFDDDVEDLIKELKQQAVGNVHAKFLADKFNDIFNSSTSLDLQSVKSNLAKLSIEPDVNYVDPLNSDFTVVAREAIYKYSEIDLSHEEADEIAKNFVEVMTNKSLNKIMGEVTESELDDLAGVGLDDILKVLSISKSAYKALLDCGDPKALRSASIIQRRLSKAGASADMIEFCTELKVKWDLWVRDVRHNASLLDLKLLQEDLLWASTHWNGTDWDWLDLQIESLLQKYKSKSVGSSVTKELLTGGVFAMLVRSGAL